MSVGRMAAKAGLILKEWQVIVDGKEPRKRKMSIQKRERDSIATVPPVDRRPRFPASGRSTVKTTHRLLLTK